MKQVAFTSIYIAMQYPMIVLMLAMSASHIIFDSSHIPGGLGAFVEAIEYAGGGKGWDEMNQTYGSFGWDYVTGLHSDIVWFNGIKCD